MSDLVTDRDVQIDIAVRKYFCTFDEVEKALQELKIEGSHPFNSQSVEDFNK